MAPVERTFISDQPAPWLHPHPSKQELHGYYGPVRQRASHRYSMPSVFCLGTLPLAILRAQQPRTACIDARLLTFRARAADRAHAAFTPGTTWPVIGTDPRQTHRRRTARPPASDATSILLTTLQQRAPAPKRPGRALSGTSSRSPPDAIKRAFSLSLTTTVFNQRSTGWFDASPRRPTPEGQQASISSTAPPMKNLPTSNPPSVFVTHGCLNTSSGSA